MIKCNKGAVEVSGDNETVIREIVVLICEIADHMSENSKLCSEYIVKSICKAALELLEIENGKTDENNTRSEATNCTN